MVQKIKLFIEINSKLELLKRHLPYQKSDHILVQSNIVANVNRALRSLIRIGIVPGCPRNCTDYGTGVLSQGTWIIRPARSMLRKLEQRRLYAACSPEQSQPDSRYSIKWERTQTFWILRTISFLEAPDWRILNCGKKWDLLQCIGCSNHSWSDHDSGLS